MEHHVLYTEKGLRNQHLIFIINSTKFFIFQQFYYTIYYTIFAKNDDF